MHTGLISIGYRLPSLQIIFPSLDWLSLRSGGHLITSLCARTLRSTKEETFMDIEKLSERLGIPIVPEDDPIYKTSPTILFTNRRLTSSGDTKKSERSDKNKSSQNSSGRVQVEYLTGKTTREFNERMGLSKSALVISNKLKGSPKR